jgi:hypothetical protein
MRAVSLVLALSLVNVGCFPHNKGARRIAQISEGAMTIAGIILESQLRTGADCDSMLGSSQAIQDCHNHNTLFGSVGVALMLGGLLGFVVTVSTAKEDPVPPKIDIKAEPKPTEDKPKLTAPIAPPPTTPPPTEPTTTTPPTEPTPPPPPTEPSGSH